VNAHETHDPRLQHVSAAVPMDDQLVGNMHLAHNHPGGSQDHDPSHDISQDPMTLPFADHVPWEVGTYEGRDHSARFSVRFDENVISGDIFRQSHGHPSETWLVSFRTTGSNAAKPALTVIAEDRVGRMSQGVLGFQDSGGDLMMTLKLDAPLDGIAFGQAVHAPLAKVSDGLRHLNIAMLREQGVSSLGDVWLNNKHFTVETAFETAGFETRVIEHAQIGSADGEGWSEKALANLMVEARTDASPVPAWLINLCLFSKSNRPGLLGIMFDAKDAQQRQWCAVYAEEIRAHYADSMGEAALMKTMMHEIGHSLNLVHRFEREVGQKNSNSIMNYDWKYKNGDRAGFWRNFGFTFDDDELAFLRHGPRNAVMPGGEHFRAARYWETGHDGYVPYRPEQMMNMWTLEILPPKSPVFFFGQPVTLGLRFQNNGLDSVTLQRGFLDQKAGFLQFEIKREGDASHDNETGHHHGHAFHPLVHRLMDRDASNAEWVTIATGDTHEDNANVTFGSGGFAFAEPGNYQITAYLSFFPKDGPSEQLVRSQTIRIRVSMPQTRREEDVALALTDPDAGQFFAHGGLPALHETESKLLEVAEHLTHGKETSGNPVAAHIYRAAAFGLGRKHLSHDSDRVQTSEPDLDAKLKLLERVVNTGLDSFDPITAKMTKQHFETLSKSRRDGRFE